MNYTAEENCVDSTATRADSSMLALLKAARSIQDRLEVALEAVGLSTAKFQALDALVQAGGSLPLSELAGRLKCVRSNITQLADRLESDGLVRREDDASDRRAIRAVVTPLGAERQLDGARAISELQNALSMRVAPDDRAVFLRVLAALQ